MSPHKVIIKSMLLLASMGLDPQPQLCEGIACHVAATVAVNRMLRQLAKDCGEVPTLDARGFYNPACFASQAAFSTHQDATPTNLTFAPEQ